MSDIQIFTCACSNGDSRLVLPRTSALGRYKRLKSPLGISEFGEEYIAVPGKWPLQFACFTCRSVTKHEAPVLGKEEPERLKRELRNIWCAEISGGPHYDDSPPIYTVTPFQTTQQDIRDFICEIEGRSLEMKLSQIPYDFWGESS